MATIRYVEKTDYAEWLRLRKALWPKEDLPGLEGEMDAMARDTSHQAVFVAERSDGNLCGMIELSIHDVVDWCETGHVGYIEGWYVDLCATSFRSRTRWTHPRISGWT